MSSILNMIMNMRRIMRNMNMNMTDVIELFNVYIFTNIIWNPNGHSWDEPST